MKRNDYCGALREKDVGRAVTVMGWAQNKRDMGGVIFIDVRDREGTLQVVFDAEKLSAEDFKAAETLKLESVIGVTGVLRMRDRETRNPRLETGTVELAASELEVLSEAETLPFQLEDADSVREELRLKYRFLDIRRPKMYKNLRFRAEIVRAVCDFLDNQGFIQVETPMLTKSTPEGARDYLVPSRVHKGKFYALPQSPQIFKQLLMVGGIDKYYQIARCFRDEDLRADRQPEFTQVDLEMSFVDQEQILELLEQMFKFIFEKNMGIKFAEPFPRLTWRQCMDTYGTDKPDLRFDLPIIDLTELARGCGFSVFRKAVDSGGFVRAINVKGCEDFSRGTIEELTAKAQSYGAKGMAWIAIKEDGSHYSILTKYFSKEEFDRLLAAVGAQAGDFILFCADKYDIVCRTLGNLRLDIADMLDLRKKDDYKFLIVTDFPEFEYSEEEGRYVPTHHPFTMPYPEDIPYLLTDPARVRAQAYDVVLNGYELGSGSIRIHRREIQQKMFEVLGFSEEEIHERFGFLVNAFRYGTPPHGGFAFGLDRLAMLMLGEDSLREVIAFPKTKDGGCPMTGAPDAVDREQLDILGLTQAFAGAAPDTAGKGGEEKIDIDMLAELSNLYLTEDEKREYTAEIQKALSFASSILGVDTAGVPETTHVMPQKNVLREDTPRQSFSRDELLKSAPQKRDGYIFVPQVVE